MTIAIKTGFIILCAVLLLLSIGACRERIGTKIKQVLIDHTIQNDRSITSVQIESMEYKLADSSAYYNHFLKLLESESESLSKIADLKTRLAQSHIDSFLSVNEKSDYAAIRNKQQVDKSLQDLLQNQKQWNSINDSMDLMLNAVHTTDTMKKEFYLVTYSVQAVIQNKKVSVSKNAVLNKNNLSVVFED